MRTTRSILNALTLLFAAAVIPAYPQTAPQTFATPEAAVQALLQVRTEADLIRLMGPGAMGAISSGNVVADHITIEGFRTAAKESLVLRPEAPDRIVVVVGKEQIPIRAPLVRKGSVWVFDVEAIRK